METLLGAGWRAALPLHRPQERRARGPPGDRSLPREPSLGGRKRRPPPGTCGPEPPDPLLMILFWRRPTLSPSWRVRRALDACWSLAFSWRAPWVTLGPRLSGQSDLLGAWGLRLSVGPLTQLPPTQLAGGGVGSPSQLQAPSPAPHGLAFTWCPGQAAHCPRAHPGFPAHL